MAGGQGTRFWPWSTENIPKQFLNIVGSEPLITQTYERLKTFIPAENIFIVADIRYLGLVMDAIPGFSQRNFITEPCARNTAPCLILSNIYLSRIDPDANVLVVPADHYIPDTGIFADQMRDALAYADNDCVVTCGIDPTSPHTGYGYLRFNEEGAETAGDTKFFALEGFVEKPDLETAEKYLDEGVYCWNSGMFAYKLSHFKNFLGEYAPYYFIQYNELEKNFKNKLSFYEVFTGIKPQSIDYALMEKLPDIKMFKSEFHWNDLGAWTTVYQLNQADGAGNVAIGENSVFIDSKDSMVFSTTGTPVAAIGLSNVAVITTENGVLVADMSQMQRVKEALTALQEKRGDPVETSE